MTLRGHIYVGELTIETGGTKTTLLKDFHRSFTSEAGMHAAFRDAGLGVRIGLVGCGSQKAVAPAKAKDLYRSPLFRAARAYAEATCSRWYILSAKFGLLDPERVVAPYEARLQRPQARAWGQRVGAALAAAEPDPNATFVCLAGAAYADAIEMPAERELELRWQEPLAGMGIGARIHWLKEHTPR